MRTEPPVLSLLINIDVADLAAATAFYTRALGLTRGRRLGPDAVELLGGSSPLYLLAKPAGSAACAGSAQTRDYGRHWTPVHIDVVVEDLAAALRRAQDAGARLEGAPSEHAWGKLALLSDPFGNGFCLLQFVGRGYDEIATAG